MARWKALPEGLDPAVVQLVVQLRQLKDETGSSLERLAVRTGYSASSWERYLGGRLLPPREALEALAKAAGADPLRLLALHQAATEAWQSGTPEQRQEQPPSIPPQSIPGPQPVADDAPEPDPEQEPGPDPEPEAGPEAEPEPAPGRRTARGAGWRGPAWRTVITSAVAALTGAAVALAVVQPWQDATACAQAATTVAPAPAPAPKYLCHYTRKDGEWYAGNSTTSTDVVQVTAAGPDVAEIQCLLQRAGISPGGVDGSFGPLTEQAVIKEQQVQKLTVDGSVGPETWGALRK